MRSLALVTLDRSERRLIRRRVALVVSILVGCTRYVAVDPAAGPQAYYQTAYPMQDMSVELERTLASVVRIHAEAWYDRYVFMDGDVFVASQPAEASAELLSRAVDTVAWNRTAAATAVIVASSRERLTLLTADHAIDFPDEVVQYFESPERAGVAAGDEGSIESISIKVRESFAMVTPSQVEPFEVLARNGVDDLALLGVVLPPEPQPGGVPVVAPRSLAPVLPMADGDPSRLSWGSFVYFLGYPSGLRMVTRGIVSEPDQRDGSFLVDGLWNEGMSGAPILAVRGDGAGLEWIGIARAAAATSEPRLVAEEAAERTQNPRRPYAGPIFLRRVQEIRYGISFSVPVNVIRRFVDRERARLTDLGYPTPSF